MKRKKVAKEWTPWAMSLEQGWEAHLRYGWLPVMFQGIWTLVLSWFCCLDRGFSVLYLHSPWSAGTPGKPTISGMKKKMTAELLFKWWTHETFDHGCQKNSEPSQPLSSNLLGRIGLTPQLESLLSVHSVDCFQTAVTVSIFWSNWGKGKWFCILLCEYVHSQTTLGFSISFPCWLHGCLCACLLHILSHLGPSCVLVEGLRILHSLLSFMLPRAKLCESSGRWGRPSRSATSSAYSTRSRMLMARKTGRARGTAAAQETQVGTVTAVDPGEQAGGSTVWVVDRSPKPRAATSPKSIFSVSRF